MSIQMTRRELLRSAALAASAGLVAACQPKVVEVTKVVEKVVKETVVVQGTPQVIEKVVKETVVVEKQVEAKPAGLEPATVVWWHGWASPGAIEAFTKIVDAYHALDKGITIDRVQVPEMQDKLLTAVAGGNPPDLGVCCVSYAQFYARGVITPLDDFIEASTKINREDFVEGLFESMMWRGKTYGVPACECGPRYGNMINVAHVQEAGLDLDNPPQTWEEMWDWHKKITKYDDAGNLERLFCDPIDGTAGNGPRTNIPMYWALATGFELWDPETLTFNFDNEQFVEALTIIKRFYDDIGVEKVDGLRDASGGWVGNPNAAFPQELQSSVIVGYYGPGQMKYHSPDVEFIVAWVPTVESRRGVKLQNVGGHPIYIPIASKVKAQAFDFIEFITDDVAVDILYNTNGWLGGKAKYYDPNRPDIDKIPGLKWYLQSALDADELWAGPVIPIDGFVNAERNRTFSAVRYGEMTPEEAAANMQKRCTEELQKEFPELVGG